MTQWYLGAKIERFYTNTNDDIEEFEKCIIDCKKISRPYGKISLEIFVNHLQHESKYCSTSLEKMMLIFEYCPFIYKNTIEFVKKEAISLNVISIGIMYFLHKSIVMRMKSK